MDSIVRGKYTLPPRLLSVRILAGFRVHLAFADGVERDLDLAPYLSGPVFEPIRNDPNVFAALKIDEAGDAICWPNGADIAPETLYYDGAPPWAKEKKPSRNAHRVVGRRKNGTRISRAKKRA